MNRFERVTKPLMWFMALLIAAFVAGCGSGGGDPILGGSGVTSVSTKAITSYSLGGVTGTINETAKTIVVTMPFGTNVTALVATFTSTGTGPVTVAGVAQVSGTTANNFTTSKAYLVTAIDGSTATYTVTVTVAASSAKAIAPYTLAGVPGIINETLKTISVTMPFGTNVTALVATFTSTGTGPVTVAGVPQVSGTTANNFTTAKAYLVTAADGSTATYTVTVTVAANTAKAIAPYSIDGVSGIINETLKTIAVTMPFGTDVTGAGAAPMIATFTSTGAGAPTIAGVNQVSGTTPNDFTTPKAYLVTAADGSTATYTVTVSVAANSAKAIAPYSIDGVSGIINETLKTIAVTMPVGTDVTGAGAAPMIATFTSTGVGAPTIAGVPQTSGTTPNNFTTPKAYLVTAADGSTATYTVTVSVAAGIPPTPGPAGAAPVLGTTSAFGIIASNAITGSASTHIFGDVALTLPSSTSTSVVGLFDSGVLPALKSSRVTDSTGVTPGIIYTTDNGGMSVSQMAQLQSDLQAAYNDNKWGSPTRVPPGVALTVPPVQPSAGGTFPTGVVDLGGMVLGPGIYAANTGSDTFALSTPLVLDAEGNADAVFVFQASDLTTTTGDVVLINGAQAKNVFWVMTATATIGTNTFFQGTIVTGNALTVNTGASVQGRMFAAATGAGALVVSGAVITVPK